MHVGILHVSLHVPEARSLKDKRQVVRSILDRTRVRFGVAAAEVEDQDLHRKAVLGFSSVSGKAHHAEEIVRKVLEALRSHPAARVIEYDLEVL
jgi:uncharacterized protein YlxP (DUF503 family)